MVVVCCIRKKNYDISEENSRDLIAVKPIGDKINFRTSWSRLRKYGGTIVTSHYNLVSHHTRSCGCLWKKEYRMLEKVTIVECLKSEVSSNNSSGVKGVCKVNGKWVSIHYCSSKEILFRNL